jgi:catechol 2,3-dioxygenase-like lactoylglutathione lyase family enzyme
VRLMPVVYVSDMRRSIDFYRALGFTPGAASRSGMWSELHLGDALLALHGASEIPPSSGRVQLAFDTAERLEEIAARLRAAGLTAVEPVVDEAYGRTLTLHDPDGLPIQIIEHDRALYT